MESFGFQTKEHCLHGIPAWIKDYNPVKSGLWRSYLEWNGYGIWNYYLYVLLYYIVILLFYVLKYKNVSGAPTG